MKTAQWRSAQLAAAAGEMAATGVSWRQSGMALNNKQ
jgi:hypothetical protein